MGQLGARPYAELRVDPRQVALDRSRRDEELRSDLFVRLSLGDELRDAPLGRRQLVAGSRTAADPRQLRAGSPSTERLRARRRSRALAPRHPVPRRASSSSAGPPRASQVRAKSKGCGSCSWTVRARSRAETAAPRSPSAARISPSQRPALASPQGLSIRLRRSSSSARSLRASSSSPSSTSASIAFGSSPWMLGSRNADEAIRAASGLRILSGLGIADRELQEAEDAQVQ